MPNPKKLTKAEKEAAERAELIAELATKLTYDLFNRNEAYTGELLALLGHLASGKNSLAELSQTILSRFYMPLANPQEKDEKKKVPNYNLLQENREKLGKYMAGFFNIAGRNTREKLKDAHSDIYIQKQLFKEPRLMAYLDGIQSAEYKCQMLSKNDLFDNNLEIINSYNTAGKEEIYNKLVIFDGEEAYSKLTNEEKDAFRREYGAYYRAVYHEECLAQMLLDDEVNVPIPRRERAALQKRMGINWHVQWKKNWASYKADREEYERWKSGELTEEEWTAIEEEAYKTDFFDLGGLFGESNASAEELWREQWEAKKEDYRRKYFDEIWAPKWTKDWEEKHHEVWHPAPEFTEEDKEDEDADWYDTWERPDDESFFKQCWLDNWKNSFRRMDSFFALGSVPTSDGSSDYEARQELLQQAEKRVKAEERKAETAGMSRKQIRDLDRRKADAENLKKFDYYFKVFTEMDLSNLTTKEYMVVRKAMIESISSMANPTAGRQKVKKWVPNDPAHASIFKLIPVMDKIESNLDYYATDIANDPLEYNKVMQNVRDIQKTLKKGASDENLRVLMGRLFLNDHDCQDYLDKYPKKFFLFNWNRNSRYNQVKKLQKECREQIKTLKKLIEKNANEKSVLELAIEENHHKAQEAVEQMQNAPAREAQVQHVQNAPAREAQIQHVQNAPAQEAQIQHVQNAPAQEAQAQNIINNGNPADYERRQSQIREGVEMVQKIRQERNSLQNHPGNEKAPENEKGANNAKHAENGKANPVRTSIRK